MKNKPYFLYAEDDEDDVVLLKDMMKLAGSHNKLVSVKNGFEAIQFLQQVKQGGAYPCLIILDMNMPRLNGKETLELLKTDDMYCLIPVLMFSIATEEDNVSYCNLLGTEVIIKPSNFDGWFDTIKKILSYIDE